MNLICGAKINMNRESSVGLLTMAGKSARILVTQTNDDRQIITSLHQVSYSANIKDPPTSVHSQVPPSLMGSGAGRLAVAFSQILSEGAAAMGDGRKSVRNGSIVPSTLYPRPGRGSFKKSDILARQPKPGLAPLTQQTVAFLTRLECLSRAGECRWKL